jgi:hypothetical protein
MDGACAAVLGVMAATGVATTEHVMVAFAFGLGTAFDNPARQSVSGSLVPTTSRNAIG